MERHRMGRVALYTSAWIEILWGWKRIVRYHVALYTSAWIEMMILTKTDEVNNCRTLHECVD